MKKFFSLVLALVMALSLTTVAWGATVTVADATAAQAALDAATPGTTIQLTAGVDYGTLYIRPVDGQANTTTGSDYNVYRDEFLRKVENLTIVGADGATVDAIVVVSGYINPANNSNVSNSTCYFADIKNLVVDSVEFTDVHTNAPHSYAAPLFFDLSYINVDGLTVKNCELIGNNDMMNFVYFYSKQAANSTFVTAAKNITITGNTVDGIARLCELRESENVTITGNTVKNTDQHAVLLASNSGKTYSGTVTVTGNTADGIGERFVRMSGAGAATVSVTGNTVTTYNGSDSDVMKLTDSTSAVTVMGNTLPAGKTVTLNSTEGAIEVTTDANGNITGGVFTTVPSSVAAGYTVATDANGNIVVLAGTNIPASAAGGAYYSTDMTNLAVYPACDLANYKYTLEPYTTGASVAKLFDQKAVWATHKITGAKILVDTYVVATSADSANVAFVDGASITYLNTNVTGWDAVVAKVPTVEYDDVAKCGDVYTGGDVALYKDAAGNLYVEGGAVKGNVDGKYVAMTLVPTAKQFYVELDAVETAQGVAMAGEVVTVKHTYAADTKTVAGKTETTKVVCKECKAEFAFVEGTPADAVKKFGAGNYLQIGAKLYVSLTPAGVSSIPSTGPIVESAETFDAGIAMYVGMSVLAATGSAVVLKKKD